MALHISIVKYNRIQERRGLLDDTVQPQCHVLIASPLEDLSVREPHPSHIPRSRPVPVDEELLQRYEN